LGGNNSANKSENDLLKRFEPEKTVDGWSQEAFYSTYVHVLSIPA